MADGAAVMEEGDSPLQSPLVAISFQRNVQRKQKYLEAEPKILGVTQISLSVFQISCAAVFLSQNLSREQTDIPFFVSSAVMIIAGSVAVAAQNLHLPTLRACLGMQIVASGASIFNGICTLVKMEEISYFCWRYYYNPDDKVQVEVCNKIESAHSHFYAEGVVIQVTLLAISLTLAAYCCKVVNCCAPAPKLPVITVQAPPVQALPVQAPPVQATPVQEPPVQDPPVEALLIQQ